MSKKKKQSDDAAAPAKGVSVSAHPRARASIRRTRAWTALAAFGIVLLLSHSSGVPDQEAVLRALVAGLIGNLVGWACALGVWRQLVLAELRVAADRREERRREIAEAAAAKAAAKAEAAAS
jgi:uncharacterized membrane protein YccC